MHKNILNKNRVDSKNIANYNIFQLIDRAMENINLRQKKFVNIKKALTEAFIERLKSIRFDEISISDICNEVGISEATFYNYFPQKIDVIFYFAAMHILKSRWILFHEKKDLSSVKKINMIFESFAEQMKSPFLFFEVTAVLSSQKIMLHPMKLEDFEKKLLFPECENIEDVSLKPIKEIIKELILEAKNKKEINDEISVDELTLLLHSVLIGGPLSLELKNFEDLLNLYKLHLSLIWNRILC